MNAFYKVLILAFVIILTSCMVRHDYIWQEYPIATERISSDIKFDSTQPLNIVEGEANDSTIFFGNVSKHYYYGSDQALTKGLVEQLVSEFKKRGLEVNQNAAKSIEVTVNKSHFDRGMWKIAVDLDFTVKLGNGKSKSYQVRNSSPSTVDYTYNGAVALAVIKIMNDPKLINYIND